MRGSALGARRRRGVGSWVERLEGRQLLSVALPNGTSNAMAYDGSGRLFLAYYDSSTHSLKYSIRSTGGTWSTAGVIDDGTTTTPTSPDVGQYVVMAVDGNGVPGVAYTDAYNADLKYAKWNPSTSSWNVTNVDGSATSVTGTAQSVGLYPSLAYNGTNAAIAYYAQKATTLRFIQQTGSGVWGAAQVADATIGVGRYPSLAMVGGRWSIAYDDTTNTTLRYVTQNSNGTWGTPATLDSATLGDCAYVSLAADSGGAPGISYYDAYNADLKYVHRNSNGAWGTAPVTIRHGGVAGRYTTLYYSGTTPSIYYQDSTNNNISLSSTSGSSWAASTDWTSTPFYKGGGSEAHAVKIPGAGGDVAFSWSGADPVSGAQNVYADDYTTAKTWNVATPNLSSQWPGRYYFGSTVANGKVWIAGGLGNNMAWLGDVWSTSDGVSWTQATSTAPWGTRFGMGMVTDAGGTMYIIGGNPGPLATADVWSSTDGANWTQVTANGGFGGRQYFTTLYFNNRIWIIGGTNGGSGYNGVTYCDVWSSGDGGATWQQATGNAAFGPLQNAAGTVFNGKMWISGGQTGASSTSSVNSVWYSSDGVTWTQAAGTGVGNPFTVRSDHGMVTYDNRMYVFSGVGTTYINNVGFNVNDVWSSVDGVNWNPSPNASVFGGNTNGRSAFGALVFNNKVWAIAGSAGGGAFPDSYISA